MNGPRRPLIPPGARDYMRYSGIGLTMAGLVAAFTFLGHWIDGLTGWRFPLFTLLGAITGVSGAMHHLFRATRKP